MCHVFAGDASFYRRIGVPSLLVYGLKDPVISLVEMCEMERTIPKSYLELIPLAGHDVMSDQPKSINVMMRKFIEKYSWPRPLTYLKRGNNSHIPSKPSKRHNYPIWCIEEIEEIWNATVLFVFQYHNRIGDIYDTFRPKKFLHFYTVHNISCYYQYNYFR